ncbi:mitochondrial mRNA pseudouridine synthase RPUSD3 [Erinaceus europaeus]|uniref:Mitochondrial mRNA pseudouridine synthase RPUSD3 n=1 Tax=Erinaceus europaeus TaxID=9365 RepID=A0A1S3WAB9_ERIEU|nr:mitochondrial mRNA pseudouridine synthase RPUSD3 [Erinaceus europaeus]
MRTALLVMGSFCACCRIWSWGRRWRPGVTWAPGAAGFGTKAWRQPQPGGSSPRPGSGSRSGSEHEPFPGLLRLETLSREALVGVLKAAVVEQRGPLVTLNKPQGLPVTGKPGELALLSVLPELSQALELGPLQVVRAPSREASGLVLLSSCPQTASRLQKFFSHSRRTQRPTATYWAVTDGIPAATEGIVQAALRLEHTDGGHLVVPVKSPSRKDILEEVKRTLTHFRVVASSSGCALVRLQPVTAFPHQLQVHMVLQLCPVLGDLTYASRVGSVLGQRFLLPAESTQPGRQVLNTALLRRLGLAPAQAAWMPLHLHLHQLQLPGHSPRDAPLELLVPLPTYFSQTLQYLGLHQPAAPPGPWEGKG